MTGANGFLKKNECTVVWAALCECSYEGIAKNNSLSFCENNCFCKADVRSYNKKCAYASDLSKSSLLSAILLQEK